MRVLLDTHALIWALEDSEHLSGRAREIIVDLESQVLVSATSAIEIAVKRSLQKLEAPDDLLDAIAAAGFIPITVDFATAERLASLPFHHRDPFDRLLIAQALTEGVPVVTRDPAFQAYPVSTIW
ncbi:MAG: type II toxin-antitoxin system VapC family toxin [Polyangiaceae bacterium]|nr:type II toxin-antitoxin system VapC family toxin [Polyangiaceae bacterium]